MKSLFLTLTIFAVALMPSTVSAQHPPAAPPGIAAVTPAAPAPAPAAPAPAQAPAQPPPVANREETTVTPAAGPTPAAAPPAPAPGRLSMILAAVTGRAGEQVANNDATITDLRSQLTQRDQRIATLEAQVAAHETTMNAAADWIAGVSQGTINPVQTPPPSPAAGAAAAAVTAGIAAAITQIGLPPGTGPGHTAPPVAAPAAPAAGTPGKPGTHFRAHWAAKGWVPPGLS